MREASERQLLAMSLSSSMTKPRTWGARALGVEGVDAVVADLRAGHGDDLAAVGGIGEDLLVAGHRGVEDHLAEGSDGSAEGLAEEAAAVFKGKDCGHFFNRRLTQMKQIKNREMRFRFE